MQYAWLLTERDSPTAASPRYQHGCNNLKHFDWGAMEAHNLLHDAVGVEIEYDRWGDGRSPVSSVT